MYTFEALQVCICLNPYNQHEHNHIPYVEGTNIRCNGFKINRYNGIHNAGGKKLVFFVCVCYGIHTSGVCHGSFLAEGYSSLVKVAAKLF